LTGVLAITAPVPVRLQERPPERRHAFPRWRASRVKEEPPNFFLFLIFFKCWSNIFWKILVRHFEILIKLFLRKCWSNMFWKILVQHLSKNAASWWF
jgi:hypothetical protein